MFGKDKKKPEYRLRFQNPRFRKKLELARGYKRNARAFPQTDWALFLSKIGLGSWRSRAMTLLCFLVLIYLVFIPNFFFVKHISISGTDFGYDQNIQTLANVYLNKKTPWPQKNLLLLSKSGLKDYLLKEDSKILSVDSINKKLPNSVAIKVTPRVDRFAVATAAGESYSVSNDGFVTSSLYRSGTSSLPSALVLIKLTGNPNIVLGQKLLNQRQLDFFYELEQKLPAVVGGPTANLEAEDLGSPDISAVSPTGLIFKFDSTLDLGKTLDRLSLLLSQAGDLKKLRYVDMRFLDRAYVCYKNTPCAAPTVIPQSTTTPGAIGN